MKGTVVDFTFLSSVEGGFTGSIQVEGISDIILFFRESLSNPLETIHEGDCVELDVMKDSWGLRALNVRVV